MKLKTGLFLFILGIITLSCLKNSETFVADKNIGDINKLLNAVALNHFTYELDPTVENTLVTSNKDIVMIPANSFIYTTGELAEGKITLSFSINPKRSIDIVNNRESILNNNLIKSFVNVDVSANQGTKVLMLNQKTGGIHFKVPYNKVADINNLNLMYWGVNNWEIEPEGELKSKVSSSNWEVKINNGTIFGSGYVLDLKKFGQFLVSSPGANPDFTTLCVTLPEHFSSKNTVAYVVFPEDNYSIKLKYNELNFCNNRLPIGHVGKVVVLSEFEGRYFYSEQVIKINIDTRLTVVPKEKSLNDITAALVIL